MPLRRFASFLLSLCLLTLPILGDDDRLWVMPSAPTTSTPIVFYYAAACEGLLGITRAGAEINILLSNGPCSPPRTEQDPLVIPLPEKVLPPGEYRVNIAIDVPTLPIPFEAMRFVVRPDESLQPFIVRPSVASTRGGIPLRVLDRGDTPILCPEPGCVLKVDGGTAVMQTEPGRGPAWIAPPHAPGFADVSMTSPDGTTVVVEKALYYSNPDLTVNPSIYERILFPMLFNTPGTGGSLWRTESSIANPSSWFVETGNVVHPIVCPPMPGAPCGEILEPRSFSRQEGGNYPHGVALLVPRAEAPHLAFHLRVRDVSRSADTLGSEVPVVRESEMAAGGETAILDVPVDPRYRARLRVYAFDQSDHQTLYTLVRVQHQGSGLISGQSLQMKRTCSAGPQCFATPFYGELDLPAAEAARVNLFVSAGGTPRVLTWAFVSVTNNDTQQVTIIGGDGAGGNPTIRR